MTIHNVSLNYGRRIRVTLLNDKFRIIRTPGRRRNDNVYRNGASTYSHVIVFGRTIISAFGAADYTRAQSHKINFSNVVVVVARTGKLYIVYYTAVRSTVICLIVPTEDYTDYNDYL